VPASTCPKILSALCNSNKFAALAPAAFANAITCSISDAVSIFTLFTASFASSNCANAVLDTSEPLASFRNCTYSSKVASFRSLLAFASMYFCAASCACLAARASVTSSSALDTPMLESIAVVRSAVSSVRLSIIPDELRKSVTRSLNAS